MVRLGNTRIHTSKVYELKSGESNGEIMLSQDIPLCGDVKVEFYHSSRLGKKVGSSFYPSSRDSSPLKKYQAA